MAWRIGSSSHTVPTLCPTIDSFRKYDIRTTLGITSGAEMFAHAVKNHMVFAGSVLQSYQFPFRSSGISAHTEGIWRGARAGLSLLPVPAVSREA
jgi:hypothetical protein